MFHDMLPDTARRLATECSQEAEKRATVKGKLSCCNFLLFLCVTNGPTTCALEGNHIPRQNKFKKSRERITFNPSPFLLSLRLYRCSLGFDRFQGFSWLRDYFYWDSTRAENLETFQIKLRRRTPSHLLSDG